MLKLLALAKIGRNPDIGLGAGDVAYRLIHNDRFPSRGFSIKHGATSIWERWNGWTPETGFADPGMNFDSAIEFPLNTLNTRKNVCHASAGIIHRSSGWVKTVSELT